MCCISPGPTINPGCRRGVRRRPCCAIMAIVADFDSYPQWNDEVKAVYALARYHIGRPDQPRTDTRDPAPADRAEGVAERHTSQIGSAHKSEDGSASDIDSGNRGLEGDGDGSSKTRVTQWLAR